MIKMNRHVAARVGEKGIISGIETKLRTGKPSNQGSVFATGKKFLSSLQRLCPHLCQSSIIFSGYWELFIPEQSDLGLKLPSCLHLVSRLKIVAAVPTQIRMPSWRVQTDIVPLCYAKKVRSFVAFLPGYKSEGDQKFRPHHKEGTDK
jgi:hypothetical protein